MKYNCDLISDLLPLYEDGICSEVSRKIVDEHLEECPECKKLLKNLSDKSIDEKLVKEKDEVISSQAKFFKRKTAFAGSIISLIFALPILICLIVNLATGSGLTWFFMVLASILVLASIVIVPLMVSKNKMFLTMASFTASVLLLFAVICIYSHGHWFFVAASSTLFGLVMLFAPFIAYRRPVKEYVKNHKGLAIMGAYTFTFLLMMVSIGLFVKNAVFFPMAASISLPLVGMAWAIFLIVRYLKANACVKTGLSITAVGILSGLLAHFAPLASGSQSITGVVMNGPTLPLMFTIGGVGLIVLGIGVLVSVFRGDKKNEKK